MCIDHVATKKEEKERLMSAFEEVSPGIRVGYKRAYTVSTGPPAVYESLWNGGEFTVGKWERANTTTVAISHALSYRSGFHAYASISAAMNHARAMGSTYVIKVHLRHFSAVGLQHGEPCLVAREQKIVEEIDERTRQPRMQPCRVT